MRAPRDGCCCGAGESDEEEDDDDEGGDGFAGAAAGKGREADAIFSLFPYVIVVLVTACVEEMLGGLTLNTVCYFSNFKNGTDCFALSATD